MSQENVTVEISSSWESGNQKELRDAITVAQISGTKSGEDGALTDMVELESCILLTQPEEENGNNGIETAPSVPCSLTLQLKSKFPRVIANVVIASEAKLIEVYGAHNEYLKTVSADLVDEVDDMAVYCADIAINQLTQNCTLKFARLSRPTNLWLYGVKVIWNDVDNFETNNSQSAVNFESVEQRLKESQTQLSGRAENCKKFLKLYSSLSDHNKSALGNSDPLSLLALLPGMTGRKRTIANSFLDFASQSFKPPGSGDISKTLGSEENLRLNSENANSHSCCDKFESILQSHLASMENRLMKALDEKIAVMQQHQEQQIQSLINLLLHSSRTPTELRLKPTVFVDQDSKIEQAIKKMMDQKHSSYQEQTRHCNEDETVLKTAMGALKFNEVFEGSTHTSASSTVVQGSS